MLSGTWRTPRTGKHRGKNALPNGDLACGRSAAAPVLRAALFSVGQAATRRILRWLAAKRGSEVSREDIRRYALGRGRDADQTQALLDNLSKAGWLRPRSKSTGGRPSVRYEVNPKLHEVAQQ